MEKFTKEFEDENKNINKIIQEYADGKSLREIAKQYNYSHEWIRKIVKCSVKSDSQIYLLSLKKTQKHVLNLVDLLFASLKVNSKIEVKTISDEIIKILNELEKQNNKQGE